MSANPIKLNSFTGTGYGEKATLVIPVGPTYNEIFLETNLTAQQLKRVCITLNGDEIIVLSGELIKMLEQYKNVPQTDGFFTISFSDITAKTATGMDYTALVTEQGDNITLEVEIEDTAESNPTGIKLQAWATISPRQQFRRVIPKIKRQTMQASGTENEFLDLLSGSDVFIRRMHFLDDKVTDLKIYRDFIKVFESSKLVEKMRIKRNERIWQSNVFHFDPTVRGYYMNELFRTEHDSELKFTVGTTEPRGSIPILVESVELVSQPK